MREVARKVLFVCEGNTCRSPMAERLLRHRARQAGIEVKVASAGLYAAEGGTAAPGARAALRRRDLDTEDHRTRALTAEMAEEADLILTMTREQKRHILSRWPLLAGKVYVLAEFAEPDRWAALLERERVLREQLERLAGDLADVQGRLAAMDVPDPVGGDDAEYERCAARLEALVDGLVRRLSDAPGPREG